MSQESPFSGEEFEGTVRRLCEEHGWSPANADGQSAVIRFGMESGRTQSLYIVRYDTTLEFSVPSGAMFDSDDDIPGALSTAMLRRNAGMKVGFWCIEEISGKRVFSFMHNAEFHLVDSEYFGRLVQIMVLETDAFEEGLLRQQN